MLPVFSSIRISSLLKFVDVFLFVVSVSVVLVAFVFG